MCGGAQFYEEIDVLTEKGVGYCRILHNKFINVAVIYFVMREPHSLAEGEWVIAHAIVSSLVYFNWEAWEPHAIPLFRPFYSPPSFIISMVN